MFRNHEFGFISSHEDVASRCHFYFDRLWDAAGADLTEKTIDRWELLLRNAVAGGAKPSSGSVLPDEGAIVALPSLVPPVVPVVRSGPLPAESNSPLFDEAEQAFVKFLGTAGDRWPVTTPILEVIGDSDCHRVCAYPKKRRPNSVRTGAVMFLARLVDDGGIIIFGRAVAIRHVRGKDEATPQDIAHLPWMATWSNFVRVHHAEFLPGTLEQGIRLSDLMETLGTDSFATTQERAAKGEKGILPQRAYGQQPSVRLSREGLDWLNDRLERTFQRHGKLSPEEILELNWPETTG